MVLRGSKTHPQSPDIFHLEQALHNLRNYIKTIDSQEVKIEHEITDLLHEEFEHEHNLDSVREQLSAHGELSDSIQVLLQRLDYLEQTHKKVEKEIEKTESEINIAVQQFLCGGVAGIAARTTVAPIDRVKLLIQTAFTTGRTAGGVIETATKEITQGGIRVMWKGNLTNCIRVFPYSALQFSTYETYKGLVMSYSEQLGREFGFAERIASGAMAGATAATLTYPLDVMRVRQVIQSDIRGPLESIRSIYAEGGVRCFYKGWTPTLISLAPFIACNFSIFDSLKAHFIPDGNTKDASTLLVLGLGAAAGLTAQTICYPLDTIRRSMQLKGDNYNGVVDCARQIYAKRGPFGFYKGIVPNAIKIVPNNGIRFLVYSKLTSYLGIPEKKIRPKKRKD